MKEYMSPETFHDYTRKNDVQVQSLTSKIEGHVNEERIRDADMAEQIVANGQADMVSLGRAMLIDPYWPQRAAKVLRAEVNWPAQYERGDIY